MLTNVCLYSVYLKDVTDFVILTLFICLPTCCFGYIHSVISLHLFHKTSNMHKCRNVIFIY